MSFTQLLEDQLAEKNLPDPDLYRYMELVTTAASRMQRLIQDLLIPLVINIR